MAIAVNHQPRHRAQHRGRVENIRQGFGDSGRSDIVGDVASKLRRRQTEILEFRRNIAAGVIAKDHESTLAAAPQHSGTQPGVPSVTLTVTSMPRKEEEGPI